MPERGVLDTSALIDLESLPANALPDQLAITAITLGELSAGPAATDDAAERARRQERLQRTEATFDPIPFDAAAARAYGRVYASVVAAGRSARGRRAVDLLIAATALSRDLPVVTRNPDDFAAIDGLGVIAVLARAQVC